MINLSSFIRLHARRTPDKTAIVFGDSRIDYRTFESRIARTADATSPKAVTTRKVE